MAAGEPRPSRFWRIVLVFFVDNAPRPLMQLLRRRDPSFPVEELVVIGRRTGRERRILLGLHEVDGRWYVGHPNGDANWVSNLVAAGECVVIRRGHEPVRVSALELPRGPERDAAIDATTRLPDPSGFVFRQANSHIRAVGRYFRLTPIQPPAKV